MTYVVRSRSGRVLRRCATRGEAEACIRELRGRTARSPATDPALWTVRRRFGVAGGPDEVVLTDEGNARAFSVGAQCRAGKPSQALKLLADVGGAGQFSTRSGSRLTPTDLIRFDSGVWSYLRERGYVESMPPEGVRLTEAGRRAVQGGLEEQKRLLVRCKQAAGAKILRSPSKSNWVGRQRSLDRYSIEELFALRKTIENAPGARRPTDAMGRTSGIYIFTPKTRKKLDDIDWAITSKLKELRAGKI